METRLLAHRSLSGAPSEIPYEHQSLYDEDDEESNCFGCVRKERHMNNTEQPDKEDDIVIHAGEQDHEFGAQLKSFEDHQQDEEGSTVYMRHFITIKTKGGPAYKMKIEKGDEIVFMNDEFVPTISHDAVLALFRNEKTDGHSKFKMIIRRQTSCGGWKWIKLSAMLVVQREPGKICAERIVPLNARRSKMKRNKKERDEFLYLYKVQGSQLYVTVSDGKVFADTLNGDHRDVERRLWRIASVEQGKTGRYIFKVFLCDYTKTWYVASDRKGRIISARKSDLFKYTQRGSGAIFRSERGHYIGYDNINNQVRAQASEYLWEEIPVQQHEQGQLNILPI